MTDTTPFGDGRDSAGRFGKGNPGNPHGERVAVLRAMLMEDVTDDDLRAIVRGLIDRAKAGELGAVKELLDRTIGKPAVSVTVEADPEPKSFHFIVKPPRVLGEGDGWNDTAIWR